MIKDILSSGALTHFAVIGLVIFVAVFVGVTVWVLTRTKREISTWSRIPLTGEEDGPLEPREPSFRPSNP